MSTPAEHRLRTPAGSPEGGQFAAEASPETNSALLETPDHEWVANLTDPATKQRVQIGMTAIDAGEDTLIEIELPGATAATQVAELSPETVACLSTAAEDAKDALDTDAGHHGVHDSSDVTVRVGTHLHDYQWLDSISLTFTDESGQRHSLTYITEPGGVMEVLDLIIDSGVEASQSAETYIDDAQRSENSAYWQSSR